jgi:hypothetical protein
MFAFLIAPVVRLVLILFPLDSKSRFVMIYRGGKSFNGRPIPRRSYEALELVVC